MNDRPEHPERASSATALVEVAQLDLRYEGCRLKSPAAEARLLSAIAAGGIQQPLQGVEVLGVRILLNGFKRLRCARKLHLATVPFVALATDETAGIVCLLRAANDHALSLLEQARFLDELKGVGGLSVAEIGQQVGRSPAWVSLRLGVLAELSPLVRGALFDGAFPVYSYLYTLRPFRRLKARRPSMSSWRHCAAKNSAPGRSSSWRTDFSGARSRCGSRSAKGIWPCRCNSSRICPRIRTAAASLNAYWWRIWNRPRSSWSAS
jgi:hypothetical protein